MVLVQKLHTRDDVLVALVSLSLIRKGKELRISREDIRRYLSVS